MIAGSRPAPPEVAAAAPVACRLAAGERELAAHHAIRRAVFVDEQRLFPYDDRDARDADPATLHAVGTVDGRIAGAVRLHPLEGALWRGDRLAVLRGERHTSLGAALVRFAVRTAGHAGGERMLAMVQLPNVRFFVVLGWAPDGPVAEYHGVAHQPMAIALSAGAGR
ncbi:MAG TPA: MSMEG_0567/Sll0786 family nitrogen starvation N-acetyltransferase [Solirubrobacteraceae bacterium]|nr:MSMEG_0567/Sll0786 family nitrogen starvation N-acetyltransferase [Solirubrobacteraceae bacterium]